jgi:uracil-DNA glycosylase
MNHYNAKKMSNINQKRYELIRAHQQQLRSCNICPEMIRPVIIGQAVQSEILLIGQAPGEKEGELGRPFAWAAGKTLFKWFESIGVAEQDFRQQVYMSAVCRCFPGKNPKGGDRVPDKKEIDNCSQWISREIELIRPRLIIPVGKLAISQYLPVNKLVDVIGRKFQQQINGVAINIIPLPHPSGASTWHRMSPGKELLAQALALLAKHQSWKKLEKLSSDEDR